MNSKTRICNSTLLVLILCRLHFRSTFEFHCVHQCFAQYHSISKNFKFRWSITGLILKALSLLSSFLLFAKCRFWKISQNQFQIIVFWIPPLPIRLFTLQYSEIMGNLLIAITMVIPRNYFSSSLVTVKFLLSDEHKGLIVQLSILAVLRGRLPKKKIILGKLFYLD